MNRHDQIHDSHTSSMYGRGEMRERHMIWQRHMILQFFALQPSGEAVTFMWYGESYLSPIPECWGIVYQSKGN